MGPSVQNLHLAMPNGLPLDHGLTLWRTRGGSSMRVMICVPQVRTDFFPPSYTMFVIKRKFSDDGKEIS